MLDTLDILIGFTVVMLIISMAVTMITQALGAALVNLRGWCLKQGIARLLALMDEGLKLPDALAITDHILRNPLVGRAGILAGLAGPDNVPGRRKHYALATVIHREELIRLLLDFAIPGDAEKAHLDHLPAEELLRHKFRKSLQGNGIDDPAAVLQSVRDAVVELEKTNPELSNSGRVAIALLNFAASNFLSKFNTWFDQTMDRVSDLFTRQIRAITAFVALLLALVLQLDAIALINRLSIDEDLRSALVQRAIAQETDLGRQVASLRPAGGGAAAPAAAGEAGGSPPANEAAAAAGNRIAADGVPADQPTEGRRSPREQLDETRRMIEGLGVVALPASWDQWWSAWSGPGGGLPMLFGILVSAALLSLGAPFWYSALANLLKLRSVLARKDEVQRTERQTTQSSAVVTTGGAAAVTADGALPPALAGGERGDLTATG